MTSDWSGTITMTVRAPGGSIRLLDLYDGSIYAIPDEIKTEVANGVWQLKNFPIRDYPMLLTFGNFER